MAPTERRRAGLAFRGHYVSLTVEKATLLVVTVTLFLVTGILGFGVIANAHRADDLARLATRSLNANRVVLDYVRAVNDRHIERQESVHSQILTTITCLAQINFPRTQEQVMHCVSEGKITVAPSPVPEPQLEATPRPKPRATARSTPRSGTTRPTPIPSRSVPPTATTGPTPTPCPVPVDPCPA